MKKMITSVLIVIIVIIGFSVATSSFYTVDQTEYAVLITFGDPSADIMTPGLKFKLPYPIQSVKKLSRETFSLTFGYKETRDGVILQENEAKMITGDENIILADIEIQWRIVDPIAFLYSTQDPVSILYNATSASLRGVVGSSTVDEALTDGRTRIMNDVRDNLTQLVEDYDIGIAIVNINLQDVDLPTQEVSDAFKTVTSAREERITKINQANRYRNEKINTAEGTKEALISRAEGQKVAKIEQARGDVARFDAIYSEYVNNKNVTSQRLIIETLQQVLPDAKVYIMEEGSNSTIKYLPLDGITRGGGN
ncbi:FtsH protease activity modulator HflK [Alkaliphilus peptidifermentans]|uniref:Protein HflK n=1 Tax=Alkaliphilus peptidifermentans DSM 18978 TaxID=1120976 RepID=A0A1G5ASX6_9FIRM|nr:FtsH protease activity modulator HflK [Alkaliphilus peptidifermentans]SCX80890.1 membrane protease subunit HflK [Alkaliphilus peptidifermentans DSM 18978]